MKSLHLIICILAILINTNVQSLAGTDATRLFIIKANNDYFKRSKHPSSDKRYTHGSHIGFIRNGTFSFLSNTGKRLQNALDCDELYTSTILMQDIYTSDNIDDEIPPADEHPFSGELNFVLGLHFRKQDPMFWQFDQQTLFSLEVSLGATGKYSFAENAQKEIHRLTGDTIPQGWDHQLASHFSGRVSACVKKRFRYIIHQDWGLSLQKTIHLSGDIGNTLVQCAYGGELRIGIHVPDDFGIYAQGPGNIGSNVQGRNGVIRSDGDRFGLYLILMAEAKYVHYDYHIGEIVTPVRGIGDLGGGIGYAQSRIWKLPAFKIELCYIRRTEEFKEQDGPHRFGTLSIVAPLN